MSKQTEIKALLHLLDDEDEMVVDHVTDKLLSYGEEVIFNLENTWEQTVDSVVHKRIEDIIQQIQFKLVYNSLENWLRDSYPDLYKGAEIIAKYQFPELDSENTRNLIEGIKQKIWIELNNELTPLETINVFNHIFYGYFGFKGDYKSKPNINDYCINNLVETKKGSSIILGVLYIILAQELNIPVYGVNLYRHFILTYQKGFVEDFSIDNSKGSMFYINTMNKGIVFEREEIKIYLKKMNIDILEDKYFSAASSKQVIKELLYYMSFFFSKNNQNSKAEDINKLRDLF